MSKIRFYDEFSKAGEIDKNITLTGAFSNWRGTYDVAETYEIHDMCYDRGYLGIATETTSDTPYPPSIGWYIVAEPDPGLLEYGALAIEDGGDGTIEGDVNAMDWTGHAHAQGTSLHVEENHVVSFGNGKGIVYSWVGPKPVLLGVGGNYTSVAADFQPTGAGNHSVLSNLDADDHPQYHTDARGDARYTPIEHNTRIDNTHSVDFTQAGASPLVHTHIETDVTDLDRVEWRNEWAAQEYFLNDMVREGAWTMIANKGTFDHAAPQPVGAAQWLLPDVPVFDDLQQTAVIKSGLHLTGLTNSFLITKVRVWVPNITAGARYQAGYIDNLTGQFTLGQSLTGEQVGVVGWYDVVVDPLYIGPGYDITFALISQNTSGDQTYNHPWTYQGSSNQEVNPGTGNIARRGDNTVLRVNTTDRDSVSRQTECANVIPGTILRVTSEANASSYIEYEVTVPTDEGGWFSYQVVLLDTGAAGEPPSSDPVQLYFTVPNTTSTDYVSLPDHWLNSFIQGALKFDDGATVYSNDAYGIDLTMQEYIASEDWDMVAVSSSTSGSSGGETAPIDNDPVGGNTAYGISSDWADQHQKGTKGNHPYSDLSDVTLASLLDGQVPTWATDHWENATPPTGVTDHLLLSNIGTNSHAQIDTHLGLVNPHLDWSADLGGTVVNPANYTNTVYPEPTFTLKAASFSVDDADGFDHWYEVTGATVTVTVPTGLAQGHRFSIACKADTIFSTAGITTGLPDGFVLSPAGDGAVIGFIVVAADTIRIFGDLGV